MIDELTYEEVCEELRKLRRNDVALMKRLRNAKLEQENMEADQQLQKAERAGATEKAQQYLAVIMLNTAEMQKPILHEEDYINIDIDRVEGNENYWVKEMEKAKCPQQQG